LLVLGLLVVLLGGLALNLTPCVLPMIPINLAIIGAGAQAGSRQRGFMLGLGRALGETMAVTFVIGNAHKVSASILAPGTTISASIANEFTEAVGDLYTSSLIALGLILIALTLTGTIGAWGWIGVVPLATGLMKFCPLYPLLGMSTCPMQKK